MTPKKHLYPDNKNSSTTALAASGEFIGTWNNTNDAGYPGVVIAVLTDADGTVFIEQSPDGVNVDSSLDFVVTANQNKVHRLSITREFVRVRYVNGSTPQTFMRLQTMFNNPQLLSSPLDVPLNPDSDAIVTRGLPTSFEIARGKVVGWNVISKFGRNPDIDSGGNEDVWSLGGLYTGFPTGAAEEFQITCGAGDVGGSITFDYLESYTSTAYSTATVTLTGTTTNTGITGVRANKGFFTRTSGAVNVAAIGVRHITTTANVFIDIPAGRGQTQIGAWTVPAGNTLFIKQLQCSVSPNNTANATGFLYLRKLNASPRYLFPFAITEAATLQDDFPEGGEVISGFADISIRIETCSANNTVVLGAIRGIYALDT